MVPNIPWVDYPRLLSIDPGGSTIGFAISEWDLKQGVLYPLHVYTHDVDLSLRREYRHLEGQYETFDLRMWCIYHVMGRLLKDWNIWQVAHETPFFGRHPQAYASLTAVCTQIRQATMIHSPHVPFFGYSPSEVKKAVGVKGRSADKQAVQDAVLVCPHLNFSKVNGESGQWDEHGFDALAVGVAHFKTHWEDFPCDT